MEKGFHKNKQKQDVYINMSFLCKQTSTKESSKIQSIIFSYFSICENVQIWDFLGPESLPPHIPAQMSPVNGWHDTRFSGPQRWHTDVETL